MTATSSRETLASAKYPWTVEELAIITFCVAAPAAALLLWSWAVIALAVGVVLAAFLVWLGGSRKRRSTVVVSRDGDVLTVSHPFTRIRSKEDPKSVRLSAVESLRFADDDTRGDLVVGDGESSVTLPRRVLFSAPLVDVVAGLAAEPTVSVSSTTEQALVRLAAWRHAKRGK